MYPATPPALANRNYFIYTYIRKRNPLPPPPLPPARRESFFLAVDHAPGSSEVLVFSDRRTNSFPIAKRNHSPSLSMPASL
ncbi:hypothetical protein PUN28_017655 [Cardiocondyla obscurior]|uniref:Uncharacterized protein n=1 Tax=Cardiocondyla obscurior TaxID=286306 RepID=A0AAW2EMD6_9HYME